MIVIKVERQEGAVQAFEISGHAGFAEYGSDIVCSAVSGISFGMINAVERLLGIHLEPDMQNDGWLRCNIPRLADQTQDDKLQLLIEAMLVSLTSVAESYHDHVCIMDNCDNI